LNGNDAIQLMPVGQMYDECSMSDYVQ